MFKDVIKDEMKKRAIACVIRLVKKLKIFKDRPIAFKINGGKLQSDLQKDVLMAGRLNFYNVWLHLIWKTQYFQRN